MSKDGDTWDPSNPDPSSSPTDTLRNSITAESPQRYRAGVFVDPDDDAAPIVELGRGGIGRVIAIYDGHLHREVARKEILTGHRASNHATARFLQEARITARLAHPNIVPVYELGQSREGTLYYTMKRVRGRTLYDALQAADGLDGRLALLHHFLGLCQGIAYAHAQGVVHRDIKPHNVMIGEFGETVVLDWGLAKMRDEDDIRGTELAEDLRRIAQASPSGTREGATLGTPAYMSPEQAKGRVDAIDERSDVFSLGAVLFEMLAGEPPYVGRTANDVLRDIREGEPIQVRKRLKGAPPELITIAEKALERDPEDRYPSAKELSEDVRAFLTGGRVEAHQYTVGEVVAWALSAYRAPVIVGAGAAIAFVAFGAYMTHRTAMQRDRAMEAEAHAMELADREQARLGSAFVAQAQDALSHDRVDEAAALAAAALIRSDEPAGRGVWIASQSASAPQVRWSLAAKCSGVAFSADGRVACAGRDGTRIHDAAGNLVDDSPETRTRSSSVAFSPDGSRLAVVRADAVELIGGPEIVRIPIDGPVAVAWSGAELVIGSRRIGGLVRIIDPATGADRRVFTAHPGGVDALAVGPGGTIATGGADHATRLWGPLGTPISTASITEGALALCFLPDGRLVSGGDATGGDGAAHLGDLRLDGHHGEVIGCTAGGDLIATTSTDGAVRLWNTAGERIAAIGNGVVASALSPDGLQLVVATADGHLVMYDVPPRPHPPQIHIGARAATDVAFMADGTLVVAADDGIVRFYDQDQALVGQVALDPLGVRALATVGDRVLAGDASGRVHAIDRVTLGEIGSAHLLDGPIWTLDVSPDGTAFAAGGDDDHVHLGMVADLAETERVRPRSGGVTTLRYESDGKLLITGHHGWLEEATVADGLVVARHEADTEPLLAVDRSANAVYRLTGGPALRLWGGDGPARVRELYRGDPLLDVAFSPDGSRIAAGSEHGLLVFDTATGAELASLPGHDNRVVRVAWSPDGSRLASASADHTVRVWSLGDLTSPAPDLVERARLTTGLVIASSVE